MVIGRLHRLVHYSVFSMAWSLSSLCQAEPLMVHFAFSDADPPTSYVDDQGRSIGVLPDLVALAFAEIPEYDVTLKAYPWVRATFNVEKGLADGLFTYPGKSVSAYTTFTHSPAYLIDYNYMFYSRDNAAYKQLAAVQSAEELKPFIMVTDAEESGSESWEESNLPRDQYPRYFVPNMEVGFNLLALRHVGDYLIRNPEEAMYFIRKLNYEEQVEFHRVQFPVENNLPFHFGIRKSHPEHDSIMQALNRVIESESFQAKALAIINSYRD